MKGLQVLSGDVGEITHSTTGKRTAVTTTYDKAVFDKNEMPVPLDLDVDSLPNTFTDCPACGATAQYNDGEIMLALEPIGRDLKYTLKDSAKALGLDFVKLMYRIYGSQTLVTYLNIIRKIRAQLLVEERDRILKLSEEMALSEEGLDKIAWSVFAQKIKSLEKEASTLDRETYGFIKQTAQKETKRTETKQKDGFVISTTLGD